MAEHKVALITNVTEFAGPPAVDALVGAGFAVFAHDRRFADEAARRDYQAGHPGVTVVAAREPEALVAEVLGAAGALHVLVSNDSYPAIVGPVEQAAVADLQATLDALVVMPFRLVGAVVPHLKRQGGGAIVMITSPRAKLPVPGGSIPDAAREAGNALMRSFARELAPHQIAVNAIAPNYFATRCTILGRSSSTTRRAGTSWPAWSPPAAWARRPKWPSWCDSWPPPTRGS
jgi:NAD(P)-dependent dehydrogenase (short-subunit alcohol dehydrogenase family)